MHVSPGHTPNQVVPARRVPPSTTRTGTTGTPTYKGTGDRYQYQNPQENPMAEDPRDRYPHPLPTLLRAIEGNHPKPTTEVGQAPWLPAVLGRGGMMRVSPLALMALLLACLGFAVAGVLALHAAEPDCRSSAPVTVLAGQAACSPLLVDSVSRVLSRVVAK